MRITGILVSLAVGGTLAGGLAAPAPVEAAAPLKLYIESTTTSYNKDRQQVFKTKTWVVGDKLRVEMIPQGGGPIMMPQGVPGGFAPPGGQLPAMVMDRAANAVFMINDANKSAMRMPMPSTPGVGPGASDPTQIEGMIKRNGGKKVGQEKVGKFQTDVWESSIAPPGSAMSGPKPPPGIIKVWLSREWKIPVRSEITIEGRGKVLTNEVTLVTRDFKPVATLFSVPKGYKIMDATKRPPPPGMRPPGATPPRGHQGH